MGMRLVGAGLGRTGTTSLKAALEQLLGGKCHHMLEVFEHPESVPTWHAAARGEAVDWSALLADYTATVDWPGAAFWPELTEEFPDAVVLLSTRDPARWYESARSTIFGFIQALFANRFTLELDDQAATIAAFEAHNAAVRAAVPADRLVEWTAADGWD